MASAAADIIWFIASPTALSSSSESSAPSAASAASVAHHGRGEPPRALDGQQEDVAAGDAVDVGDVGAHGGHGEALNRLLGGLLGAVAGDDGADARGAGGDVLQGALHRFRGGLAEAHQWPSALIASPPR